MANTSSDAEFAKYLEDYEGKCGTCHYWKKDGNGYSCMCFDSPFAADWTDIDDDCSHYILAREVFSRAS